MQSRNKVDKPLLIIIFLLTVLGIFIFLSASLGLLAKSEIIYSNVIMNQIVFGLIGGLILMFITSKIPYKFWKIHSFWIFLGATILTLLVFTGLGSEFSSGARRWISIGSISFQPSELLKFAYLFYVAAWLSMAVAKDKIKTFKYGTLPFIIISGIVALILFFQPDNDTMIITLFAGAVMYFVSGANFKHIAIVIFLAILGVSMILFTRPYVVDRIITFINPGSDPLTSGYQIQQSLLLSSSIPQ